MIKPIMALAVVIVFVTTTQAEIICTNRGCWETGMRIFRNGSGYRGLPVQNNRAMALDKSGYPQPGKRVRIVRDSW